jgi:hypothetical protein
VINPRSSGDPSLTPVASETAAATSWINSRLLKPVAGATLVGTVVPTGFPRVVRVLHPIGDGDATETWADVARRSDRVVHPLVQWTGICNRFDGQSRSSATDPLLGSAPPAMLGAVLEHCPSTLINYAVWEGSGSWAERAAPESLFAYGPGAPQYRLFVGPKAPHSTWPGMDVPWSQTANLMWPSDASWCIATAVDLDSTLVAGASSVADGLLADDRLEVFEVTYTDDISWYGDEVNPRPSWLASGRYPGRGL